MKKISSILLLMILLTATAEAGIIKGSIKDKQTKEPLTGATVQIAAINAGTVADLNGNYTLHVANGIYTITVTYIGYKPIELRDIKAEKETTLNFEMEADMQTLADVTITGRMKKNTEISVMTDQRRSLVVQSGVSAQQIGRTQDKDASEVIKRVPGISVIDDKFVMVRGLSQRYNNVWINGSAVPSSEADSRAFSFDLIPSSQLDNMIVVKSPAPEYPSDFTGGFILIQTKDVPSKSSFSINLNGGLNDRTHFNSFLYEKESGTDFLGFDNGLRSLKGGIDGMMNPVDGLSGSADLKTVDLTTNSLNNDWAVRRRKPFADAGMSLDFSRHWESGNGREFALSGAVNYSNSYKVYEDMENSLFGAYDEVNDRSNYLRRAKDNQYNHDVRAGAMLNFTFSPAASGARYEFRSIFNQLGKSRYTDRRGWDAQENRMESAEYYYSSRTTYNGQLTGKHLFDRDKLDWSAGYAYSARNMPDRRRYTVNDEGQQPGHLALIRANDIRREFTDLDEHIFSGNLNYQHIFQFADGFGPMLKTGAYGEYRTRTYTTREFLYNWNPQNTLPAGFEFMNIPDELMQENNYGADKLYLIERPKWRNNYEGNNTLFAGYAAVSLPLGAFNIYAGMRFEHNRMELIGNTRDVEKSPKSLIYRHNDLFPSVNIGWQPDEKHQLRLSYGRSVNRPEFREVSSSVFYDFDLGSSVQGNTELSPSYIDNADFRYEYYPTSGEQVSVALFYKHFNSPIEWTYTMTGGETPVYSFHNAKSAYSLGVEVDIRKDLAFIGLRNFTCSFNGALIKSRVDFDEGAQERDRPMQGQSPYLINAGLFYQHPQAEINLGLLYNRIGKRIIGVGRTVGTVGGENTVNIPDSYEMPRNMIDLSVSKRFGSHWLLKTGIRNLLTEKVYYKLFNTVTRRNGMKAEIEEITKSYRPGRSFNLSVGYRF